MIGWKRGASDQSQSDVKEEILRMLTSDFTQAKGKVIISLWACARRCKDSSTASMKTGLVVVTRHGAGWRCNQSINSILWQSIEVGNYPEAIKSFLAS